MILPCICENRAQDELNGRGRRVFNPCGVAQSEARCTNCGAKKAIKKSDLEIEEAAKLAPAKGKK